MTHEVGSMFAIGGRWRMRIMIGALATCAALASQVDVGLAQEALVPPGVQAALTLRILEYDRALKTWAGSSLTVGVVTKDTGGKDVADLRQALAGRDAQGVSLKVVDLVYHDPEGLARWLDRSGVRFLYLDSELGGDAARAVLSTTLSRRLPTLTTTRGHFDRGGALGIVVKEGKPRILIKLDSAKAAGMDLDPKLLQLSEVVR